MTYRKSPRLRMAQEEWRQFIASHERLFAKAGIESGQFCDHSSWEFFLFGASAEIAELSEDQYEALAQIVDDYFSAGYEYFTPVALLEETQARLDARYGS